MNDGEVRFSERAASPFARVRPLPFLSALAVHVAVLLAGLSALSEVGSQTAGHRAASLAVILISPADPPGPRPLVHDAKASRPRLGRLTAVQGSVPRQPIAALLPGAETAGSEPRPVNLAAPLRVPALAPALALATDRAEAQIEAVAARPQSPHALTDYRARVWQHIAARKPRGVRAAGTVKVRFHIGPGGAVLVSDVTESSGDLNLDRIALRAVRQASPLPPPPEGLVAGDLVFIIPLHFR